MERCTNTRFNIVHLGDLIMWPQDTTMPSLMKVGFYLNEWREAHRQYYIDNGWNGEPPEEVPDFTQPEWNDLTI